MNSDDQTGGDHGNPTTANHSANPASALAEENPKPTPSPEPSPSPDAIEPKRRWRDVVDPSSAVTGLVVAGLVTLVGTMFFDLFGVYQENASLKRTKTRLESDLKARDNEISSLEARVGRFKRNESQLQKRERILAKLGPDVHQMTRLRLPSSATASAMGSTSLGTEYTVSAVRKLNEEGELVVTFSVEGNFGEAYLGGGTTMSLVEGNRFNAVGYGNGRITVGVEDASPNNTIVFFADIAPSAFRPTR